MTHSDALYGVECSKKVLENVRRSEDDRQPLAEVSMQHRPFTAVIPQNMFFLFIYKFGGALSEFSSNRRYRPGRLDPLFKGIRDTSASNDLLCMKESSGSS